MLEELIQIMDFNQENPNIRELIEYLIDQKLSEEVNEVIYELSASCYELGRAE